MPLEATHLNLLQGPTPSGCSLAFWTQGVERWVRAPFREFFAFEHPCFINYKMHVQFQQKSDISHTVDGALLLSICYRCQPLLSWQRLLLVIHTLLNGDLWPKYSFNMFLSIYETNWLSPLWMSILAFINFMFSRLKRSAAKVYCTTIQNFYCCSSDHC